ncbi:EF-P lysine aminoacylase GenX [bacterium]|nr:EF-P lysine aminoacylase GenX [bacterium]
MMHQKTNWQKLKNVDLDWSIFHIRAKMLDHIRKHFNQQGFFETEAPIVTHKPTLDNNIDSIACKVKTPDNKSYPCYLHTSPEYAMKKLLSAGSGNIYYLGKVFRDGELTVLHNPEYTMAEWYRVEADYHDIMKDVQNLICDCAKALFNKTAFMYKNYRVDLEPPWPVLTVSELFEKLLAVSSFELQKKNALAKTADKHGIHYTPDDDWETLFHRLFIEKIEPALDPSKPTFIIDYPIRLALMARHKHEDDHFAERVELYIAGMELANGYSELTDPDEQLIRFKEALNQRSRFNAGQIDHDLIQALQFGMPPCAGMALGVDRLLMFFLDKSQIRDVLLFPFI